MEDSFKVRVDRAFGSLEATASSINKSTPSSSSLWCLTDQEIERNEWIQVYKEKHPKPPSFLHPDPESDIQSNEEWNVLRSSLGMDCTLDNEEEEDAFDKVALCEEEERFYHVEIDELPNSFTDAIGDPRADLMAAKLRLKQDDEAAAVPDYVRNPSRYTRYTFDSMDEEESNKKAYMELLNSVKGRRDDVSSTSIVFTPRNKSSDDDGSVNKSKANLHKNKVISIAADAEDEEACAMEEDDEPATNKTKGGRKYRTKGSANVE